MLLLVVLVGENEEEAAACLFYSLLIHRDGPTLLELEITFLDCLLLGCPTCYLLPVIDSANTTLITFPPSFSLPLPPSSDFLFLAPLPGILAKFYSTLATHTQPGNWTNQPASQSVVVEKGREENRIIKCLFIVRGSFNKVSSFSSLLLLLHYKSTNIYKLKLPCACVSPHHRCCSSLR